MNVKDSQTNRLAGGSAYGLIFAADGSSAILLAQDSAKETNVLNFIPWATVYYLHSLEESLSPVVFERASVFEWLHDAPAIRASKYYGAK